MAYIAFIALLIGIPFYLLWRFIKWIFFSDNPESKIAQIWDEIMGVAYSIVLLLALGYIVCVAIAEVKGMFR